MTRAPLARATTLVEILLGLALAAMLMVSVSSGMITQARGVRINDSQMRSRHAANATVNYVLAKVRRAKELTLLPADASGNSYSELITLDEAQWDDAAGAWTNGTCSRFYVDGGDLVVQEFALGASPSSGRTSRILHNVENVSFRSVKGDTGHASVTLELNLDYPDDMFRGTSTGRYAIAGTSVARNAR